MVWASIFLAVLVGSITPKALPIQYTAEQCEVVAQAHWQVAKERDHGTPMPEMIQTLEKRYADDPGSRRFWVGVVRLAFRKREMTPEQLRAYALRNCLMFEVPEVPQW